MLVKDMVWKEYDQGDNTLHATLLEDGTDITVLDRATGWSFIMRDIETGYRDLDGKFWLASGMFDIRDYPELTVEQAIAKIKQNANTCVGK